MNSIFIIPLILVLFGTLWLYQEQRIDSLETCVIHLAFAEENYYYKEAGSANNAGLSEDQLRQIELLLERGVPEEDIERTYGIKFQSGLHPCQKYLPSD